MTGVFIAAQQRDKKMWNTLPAILENHFLLLESVSDGGEDDADTLLLKDIDQARYGMPDPSILVVKDLDEFPYDIPANGNTIAIVDSSAAKEVLKQVSESKVPAITCGMSQKDTVTISSIAQGKAVVTLQRAIRCFNGVVAEPQEIPLKLKNATDVFTIMCGFIILLLTGRLNSKDIMEL